MRLLNTLAAALLVGASALHAQQPSAPNFKRLEFLVGRCWVGTFPDGKATDEHCFEWVYVRKFIRDKHVVRPGTYQGETLYSWDPKTQRPVYAYYNSEGQVIQGSVEYAGNDIVFPSHYNTPTGAVEIKAVWTLLGQSAYKVVQSQRSAGEWKTLLTMEMKAK